MAKEGNISSRDFDRAVKTVARFLGKTVRETKNFLDRFGEEVEREFKRDSKPSECSVCGGEVLPEPFTMNSSPISLYYCKDCGLVYRFLPKE